MNKFYTKRYLRILPFFALLCMLDILLSPSYDAFLQGFMNCTLVFNLLPNPDISVIGVGWFLGIIFVFYMLFPFFIFLIDNRKRAWSVLFFTFIIHHICTNYFFLAPFITFNPGRHQILYSAPYFIVGGLIYLYRSDLKNIIIRLNKWALPLVVFITIIRFICVPYVWNESLFYVDVLLFSAWTIYAIGSSSRWFNNRIIDYLSEVSMEIYLSHMVIFRAVGYLHLADHISNPNILYIITSILVLIGAVSFSHITKYYLLNRLIKS